MQPMMCILRYTYMARVCKIVLLKKLTSSLVIWTWLVTWSIPVKSEGLISYQPNIYLSKLFNVLFIMILISIEKGNTNVNLEKSSFFRFIWTRQCFSQFCAHGCAKKQQVNFWINIVISYYFRSVDYSFDLIWINIIVTSMSSELGVKK